MGLFNWVPKTVKRTVRFIRDPLKGLRDVSGYTAAKKQAEEQQRKMDEAAARAEERNAAAEKRISEADEKRRQTALAAARGRSASRRARGGARGYRSLLSPANESGSRSLSGR